MRALFYDFLLPHLFPNGSSAAGVSGYYDEVHEILVLGFVV